MPLIMIPTYAIDAEVLSACEAHLKYYASQVLSETAIVAPNTGYKMYRKRQAMAQKLLSGDATVEIKAFAILASQNSELASLRYQAEQAGTTVYRFLFGDNPTSKPAAEAGANTVNWSSGAVGDTLFDKIAGVTNEDTL